MKYIDIPEDDWNLILSGKKTCLISDQFFYAGEKLILRMNAADLHNSAKLIVEITHCELLSNGQILASLYCKSNVQFFSFDLDNGFKFHDNMNVAMEFAKKSIDKERSKIVYPNDQWPNEMEEIGVGYCTPMYLHRAEAFNEQPVSVDEDDEIELNDDNFTCDYRLSSSIS
jgi:hypothetical protein